MLDAQTGHHSHLPIGPGVGYKSQHFSDIMHACAPIEWFEIHAENYMGKGGRPIAQLRALRERFPISLHGVGLSIGAEAPLDTDHLERLRRLCDWLKPASFSEHLAWSTHDGVFINDLLPVPYTQESLDRVSRHIDQVQTLLDRQMLLENPSSYLFFEESEMSEIEFLTEISRSTGCGLLLDVNNVYVSAVNQKFDARAYIDRFPLDRVGEIHLAGHSHDQDEDGSELLIDSHDTYVADPVWALFEAAVTRGGAKPTLIEWDNDVPDWRVLTAQAQRLCTIMPAGK